MTKIMQFRKDSAVTRSFVYSEPVEITSERYKYYSARIVPLDEKSLYSVSVNINFSSSIQVEEHSFLTQIIDELNLSNIEKKVLRMKYCKDLTDKEIAISLGVTRQAISKVKAHTLSKIKDKLLLYL
ncbi:sigma factor-like helix-turn-helix DNA-binding protein [Paenibacillus segetis]|uniref:RNA polymerase sigma-70 region 4 domain-containing protein n=1 Tax=Paenibacillus segetis TaxID=1325360 RepID=A0ABQ1YQX3_9BACL|nr:sigma factor-like helix-turn-helix DNA-binding protein [Paenibacillus segetis]GGH35345.1 hypothetical protein GCM10008013_41600 [Paenibacillus segetis]